MNRPRQTARNLLADSRRLLAGTRWILPATLEHFGRGPVRLPSRRWRAELLRQRLVDEPTWGMTALTERAYLRWHAREIMTGAGAAVDLGCGLGSTTISLARGLAESRLSRARHPRLHAFDRFVWEEWMEPYARAAGLRFVLGGSFRAEFEARLVPWRHLLVVHEGDLLEEREPGEPIELLHVDAMKSWPLAARIVTEFHPTLLTGGHVIHQDFSHCFTPWIPLIVHRLRGHLTPVQDIEQSETVCFRVDRQLDPSELALGRESFDEDEVEAAFKYCLQITPPAKHSGLRAARVVLAVQDGDLERARGLAAAEIAAGGVGEFHAGVLRAAVGLG